MDGWVSIMDRISGPLGGYRWVAGWSEMRAGDKIFYQSIALFSKWSRRMILKTSAKNRQSKLRCFVS